jgi:signal transduction histidine kinase
MAHDEVDETSIHALGIATRRAVHDLNNLMSTILGIVELMDETMSPNDPMREDILEIQRASLRAVTCAKQLHQISCKLALVPG